MKRILAVHDLSCYGAASLGIAIPVLTAFGYKVVALPSVILSSTTDIDQDPVILETTEWMYKVAERWEKQHIVFDAVYTGWLGDPRQIDLIAKLCEESRNNKVVIFIDPVLGDCGALYPCQAELAKTMNRLVEKAQIITPNPTEAALLLDKQPGEYGVKEDGTITPDLAEELVRNLADKYPGVLPIVKSVAEANRIGVCVRFTSDNTISIRKPVTEITMETRIDAPPIGGSGDLFASLLIGRWLKEESLRDRHDKMVIIRSVVKTISDMMKMAQNNQAKDLPFRKLLSIS